MLTEFSVSLGNYCASMCGGREGGDGSSAEPILLQISSFCGFVSAFYISPSLFVSALSLQRESVCVS